MDKNCHIVDIFAKDDPLGYFGGFQLGAGYIDSPDDVIEFIDLVIVRPADCGTPRSSDFLRGVLNGLAHVNVVTKADAESMLNIYFAYVVCDYDFLPVVEA